MLMALVILLKNSKACKKITAGHINAPIIINTNIRDRFVMLFDQVLVSIGLNRKAGDSVTAVFYGIKHCTAPLEKIIV